MEIDELDAALEDLEQRLERLRSLYEQYFLGLEKIEPAIARKDVDRKFFILRRTKLRNTARRFRLQLLVQRYNTFQQYWLRICRQIENGTYTRHLIKAEAQFGKEALTFQSRRRSVAIAKAREAAGMLPSRQSGSGELPASTAATAPTESPGQSSVHTHRTTRLPAIPGKSAAAPSPPKQAAAGAVASPAGSGSTELTEQRVKDLHTQLLAEKMRLADTASVSLDSLSKSLHEAAAKLRSVHGDRSVDFRVVVKGGKAMVKPVLR